MPSSALSKTKPTSLEISYGTVRLFGTHDIDQDGFVAGWATPEESHSWNDGVEAVLCLNLPYVPSAACILTFEGRPFIHHRQPMQEVAVFANGHRAGFWRALTPNDLAFRTQIEPEWIYSRNGKGYLNLAWQLPYSVRPSDIESSSDGRELGFCFRTLMISE